MKISVMVIWALSMTSDVMVEGDDGCQFVEVSSALSLFTLHHLTGLSTPRL